MSEFKNLVTALIKAKKEFTEIKKDKVNSFFKSNYADLSTYIQATENSLTNNELVIFQTIENVNEKQYLCTKLVHSSGESIESNKLLESIQDPQKFGSMMTYYRKYCYAGMLMLTSEDDDGNETKIEDPKNKVQPKKEETKVEIKKEEIKKEETEFEKFKKIIETSMQTSKDKNEFGFDFFETKFQKLIEYSTKQDFSLAEKEKLRNIIQEYKKTWIKEKQELLIELFNLKHQIVKTSKSIVEIQKVRMDWNDIDNIFDFKNFELEDKHNELNLIISEVEKTFGEKK